MSWSVAVNDVPAEAINVELSEQFAKNYKAAALPGARDKDLEIRKEFRAAVACAEDLAWDVFDAHEPNKRFNVSTSGHVTDNDSESFVSVIVTLRKPEAKTETPDGED